MLDLMPDEIIILIYQYLLFKVKHDDKIDTDTNTNIDHVYRSYISKYYSFDAFSKSCKKLNRCSKDMDVVNVIYEIKIKFIHLVQFNQTYTWYLFNILKSIIDYEYLYIDTVNVWWKIVNLDNINLLKIIPITYDPNERLDISNLIWKLCGRDDQHVLVYMRLMIKNRYTFPIEKQLNQVIYTLSPHVLIDYGIMYNAMMLIYILIEESNYSSVIFEAIKTAIRRYIRLHGNGSNKTLISVINKYKMQGRFGKFKLLEPAIEVLDRIIITVQILYKKYIKLPIRYRH